MAAMVDVYDHRNVGKSAVDIWADELRELTRNRRVAVPGPLNAEIGKESLWPDVRLPPRLLACRASSLLARITGALV